MEDMAISTPRIYAALDDHQAIVVDVGGNIVAQYISILIALISNHIHIHPNIVEVCVLNKSKHRKLWLVQLATGRKRKTSEVVEGCPLMLDGLSSETILNIWPLGLYDVLIGMDWIENHQVKLECYNKSLECLDGEGKP